MRGLKTTAENYPPIFAVVMRRPGATRLLECHAFACKTEDDAVAAAATLYRALLADLDANRRRPRHTNGVGCVSLASIASSDRKPSLSSRLGIRTNILQAESVKPTTSHPVRPPRTKKTSVSSSVTEDETSKPSELQKAPRRKKKNSDVKAEDILEARGRRRETPKEKMIPLVQNFNSIQKNFDSRVSEKEEWQNSKNKIFGTKSDLIISEKIEIDNFNKSSSKIYDIGASGLYETVSNRYETCPVSGKAGKNESLKKQSPDKESENIKDKMYEKTRDSYELIPSKDISKSQETYSSNKSPKSNALIHDRIKDKPTCKSEENSLYERANKRGSKERLYEDHFKDVDKIYSLAQEDVQSSRTDKLERGKIRSSQEDIFFGRSRKSDFYQLNQENFDDSVPVERRRSRDQEKCTSGRRVSRVVTMDKPLKKPLSDSTSNLDLSEYNQPRIRKRSRAGSEPPVSRSEDATKNLQEGKLKRSQSDIDVDRGDLMTRVELPRRGSFLNPGSARRPNSIKGGTPLGFTELFDEFRNQEGLTSVDDILAAIIGNYRSIKLKITHNT